MNAIELAIFANRINNVCEEMGAVLRRAAFSPNIKDRLDYSCALFDQQGRIIAQAAHIPVHLGSMAFAMRDLVEAVQWQAGDMVVVNDPYLGGTHLPDVTLIAPVFSGSQLQGFVANRAHHVNIGATSPGSMPISSRLEDEGIVIAPSLLVRKGTLDQRLLSQLSDDRPVARGDFLAQLSANGVGAQRFEQLVSELSEVGFNDAVAGLHNYGNRLAQAELAKLPSGQYQFSDCMDDDGQGNTDVALQVCLTISEQGILADFTGTADQVAGNINCPLSVAAAAVFYCFRCLLPSYTPACAGVFDVIKLAAPEGCLVNAQRPAAVAAGNVETSMRLVDLVLGALAQALPEAIPAAAQGTMNNIAMGADGDQPWDYYETIAGGTGGHAQAAGLHCVQSHMTNTLNTPIESLESHFPVRIRRYQQRLASGGQGLHPGGDGLIREFEFLAPAQVTLLTERRRHQPWGLAGGGPGRCGENTLNGEPFGAKQQLSVQAGDRIAVATPGGGGWGTRE
ncbi:hydantoinase B/oxoprolinase family protein [Halioxenophilus aromaticivorans]|uniref:Hydantoinase B/oxoprolinase family protein n=1 Tax=Halioxenophilus aromaticivorans TaxID=1306992 RepID=A0AAV3TYC9_9ALTE